MKQLTTTDPVRLNNIGAGETWSVFASGVTGPIKVQVSTNEGGPFVTALTITEDGVHPTMLSRRFWARVDIPGNAGEIWIV